jgi:hypothetical protein
MRNCPLGGDADHCDECAYYPDYNYNEHTGECERRDEMDKEKKPQDLGINVGDGGKVEEHTASKKTEPAKTLPEYEIIADKMMHGKLFQRPDIKRELNVVHRLCVNVGDRLDDPQVIAMILFHRGIEPDYSS